MAQSGIGLIGEQTGQSRGAQGGCPVAQEYAPIKKILGRAQVSSGKEKIGEVVHRCKISVLCYDPVEV